MSGAPSAHASAGRYAVSLLPENLCDKVQLGRLATSFEAETAAPTHQRNLTTVVGTSTCALSRQHGAVVAAAGLTFSALVYADTDLAVSAQQQNLDNAKLNDPNLIVVKGLGDEAFVNRMPSNSATAAKDAHYALDARDGNLVWMVFLTATRVTGPAWTDQERAQLVADLEASVKATRTRLTSA